ncbi:putative Fe-S cluster assembly protein SufT [Candidatus Marinimicrobia bacterium]|jgi:probable FeS assembly SUF system protein SufT|nr:putative Fe-S cluster assembly protein SufT [Candidatus Neomarinimicrobiota bacterium]MDC0383593.1 putative Fe-S cluster assembly protein SufT [Candidatus Neomarinimicrobiota bacterium]
MNEIPTESVRLLRDVDAYMVPSGDEVKLLAGNLVKITQALGGNYTVIMNGNMVQIREENADALGMEIAIPKASSSFNGDITQQVWDQLKTCYDPEIPVNIVELGLIYDLNVLGPEEDKKVEIQMTLTAPGCGMGPVIAEEVDRKINGINGVTSVKVDLVWEPMWNRDMMSEEAKLELGML